MQKPHWSACASRKAACNGVSSPLPASPSTVSSSAAVDLDREEEAGAHGDAVEPHRARAADAVLAADVRAGEAERVADEVGEQQPRLDTLAVEGGR